MGNPGDAIPDGIDDAPVPTDPLACGACYPHPAHRANLCTFCLCSHEGTPVRYAQAPGSSLLTMAEALDAMDADVTEWEGEFLDSTLKTLRAGWSVTPRQERVLREMHARYLEG